jgi:hypothetical protein
MVTLRRDYDARRFCSISNDETMTRCNLGGESGLVPRASQQRVNGAMSLVHERHVVFDHVSGETSTA